jgi:hypothetical protein
VLEARRIYFTLHSYFAAKVMKLFEKLQLHILSVNVFFVSQGPRGASITVVNA